jgi:hypothetical protein
MCNSQPECFKNLCVVCYSLLSTAVFQMMAASVSWFLESEHEVEHKRSTHVGILQANEINKPYCYKSLWCVRYCYSVSTWPN